MGSIPANIHPQTRNDTAPSCKVHIRQTMEEEPQRQYNWGATNIKLAITQGTYSRRNSCLIPLFKFQNRMQYGTHSHTIPTSTIPLTITRTNHNQKLMQLYARTVLYYYSFLLRTIPDWNNLGFEDQANCDLDSFKDYIFSSC